MVVLALGVDNKRSLVVQLVGNGAVVQRTVKKLEVGLEDVVVAPLAVVLGCEVVPKMVQAMKWRMPLGMEACVGVHQ